MCMEILEMFSKIEVILNDFLMNAGVWAPILSCILVFLEGILAFLPLFLFVTVNVLTMGNILGVIFSWIFSTLGGFTTFLIIRKSLNKPFRKRIVKKTKANKFMKVIDGLKYSQLVLLTSIPFSPSFFINLGAGLSNVNAKKYFCALIVGKFVEMIFLAYVGVSLVECLTNPIALIEVIAVTLAGYLISLVVNKKFDLDSRF